MPIVTNNITVSAVGASVLNTTDPSSVSWIRVNADNTITYRSAAQTLSDLGAQAAGTYLVPADIGVTVQGYNANTTILGNSTTGSGSIVLATSPTIATSLILDYGTASTVVYLNASKQLISLANASGVLTNDGSGGLTWAASSSGITIGGTAITGGADNRILFQDATASDYVTQIANFTMGAVATGYLDVPTGYAAAGVRILQRPSSGSIFVGGSANPTISGIENTIISEDFNVSLTGTRNTFIGRLAYRSGGTTGVNNSGIGARSLEFTNGSNNVCVGTMSHATVNNTDWSISIGAECRVPYSHSIVIGGDAAATTTHQGILGSNSGNGYISNWYFNGVTHTAPYSVTLNASGASGSNVAGCTYTHAASKGTGSGTPGTLVFQTATTLGSGTTLQSLVSRLIISGGAVTTDASTATWADALDFVFGATTGSKFGTATTQKIGFWNATPLAQQTTASAAATFVTNTSLIADDTATFDGYTIGQVVKILRNLGILA